MQRERQWNLVRDEEPVAEQEQIIDHHHVEGVGLQAL